MMLLLYILILVVECLAQNDYNDLQIRVAAGERTCFYQRGRSGQTMEVYYHVVDGQHGDLDISLDITDPAGANIAADYKRPQNAIIRDLALDGDYSICLDNTYSSYNSKLVFIYVMTQYSETAPETEVAVVNSDGNEVKEETKEQVDMWTGIDENGSPYTIEVDGMADYVSRTQKHIAKARHYLDLYSASKSRDSYLAYEETFVVDVWSGFQISFMCVVGLLQVYMIKKLFSTPKYYYC